MLWSYKYRNYLTSEVFKFLFSVNLTSYYLQTNLKFSRSGIYHNFWQIYKLTRVEIVYSILYI